MFPLIPFLALSSILGGGGVLAWYSSLSRREQQEADAHANEYARLVFEKQLDQLTQAEADHIHRLTRRRFG